jgi:hypothetical protein
LSTFLSAVGADFYECRLGYVLKKFAYHPTQKWSQEVAKIVTDPLAPQLGADWHEKRLPHKHSPPIVFVAGPVWNKRIAYVLRVYCLREPGPL